MQLKLVFALAGVMFGLSAMLAHAGTGSKSPGLHAAPPVAYAVDDVEAADKDKPKKTKKSKDDDPNDGDNGGGNDDKDKPNQEDRPKKD